jgi:hypothetical protein
MEIWSGWRGDVGVTVRLDRVVHSRKARGAFWPAPYRHRELSAGTKNTLRLCQSTRLIGDMAHAQIRHHDVKFSVVKGRSCASASMNVAFRTRLRAKASIAGEKSTPTT